MSPEQLIREAVNRLLLAAPGARVILFGSHARGDAKPDSDLDFLVLEPKVIDHFEEAIRLRKALEPLPLAADIVVMSMDRFEYWKDTPNTIVYKALKEGIVYESVA